MHDLNTTSICNIFRTRTIPYSHWCYIDPWILLSYTLPWTVTCAGFHAWFMSWMHGMDFIPTMKMADMPSDCDDLYKSDWDESIFWCVKHLSHQHDHAMVVKYCYRIYSNKCPGQIESVNELFLCDPGGVFFS